MSDLPEQLKYARTHEWAYVDEHHVVRVGISDFAQAQLGDVMYVTLPELGRAVSKGEACAVIESVKVASDLHSPVTGTIVAINDTINDAPEAINETPYQTWLFAIQADDLNELNALLSAQDYQQRIDE